MTTLIPRADIHKQQRTHCMTTHSAKSQLRILEARDYAFINPQQGISCTCTLSSNRKWARDGWGCCCGGRLLEGSFQDPSSHNVPPPPGHIPRWDRQRATGCRDMPDAYRLGNGYPEHAKTRELSVHARKSNLVLLSLIGRCERHRGQDIYS
jgi:hypothetical protein